MESTAKKQCNILVDVLIAHGIRHFVMSPGSRNAPIIVALARRDEFSTLADGYRLGVTPRP